MALDFRGLLPISDRILSNANQKRGLALRERERRREIILSAIRRKGDQDFQESQAKTQARREGQARNLQLGLTGAGAAIGGIAAGAVPGGLTAGQGALIGASLGSGGSVPSGAFQATEPSIFDIASQGSQALQSVPNVPGRIIPGSAQQPIPSPDFRPVIVG